jgi:hypothetical protein
MNRKILWHRYSRNSRIIKRYAVRTQKTRQNTIKSTRTEETSIVQHQTAPEGTLNIELKVTINNPPIANANGPYTGVIEYIAVPILFDGTGSYASDPDGTIISYNWVLDDDGKFDDAVGATPTVSFTAPSTGNIQAVKLVLRTHR